jgi:hypothetical protein
MFVVARLASSGFRSLVKLSDSGKVHARAIAWPRGSARLYAASTHIKSSAATIRGLNVLGVVAFIKSIGVDAEDALKLLVEKVDGAALLEMTEDKLRSCGVRLGPASAIMRAIAEAQEVTLDVYPPLKKKGASIPVSITLTPESFIRRFAGAGPNLRLVNADGVVLKEIMTLREAVDETTHNPAARLRTTHSFDE